MRKPFTKSTDEEIQQMRDLYRIGMSLSEIGRRLGKNHSSILWHICKTPDYIPGRMPIKVSEETIRTILKIPEKKIVKKEIMKQITQLENKLDETPFNKIKELERVISEMEQKRGKDSTYPIRELLERTWLRYDKLNEMITNLEFEIRTEKGFKRKIG